MTNTLIHFKNRIKELTILNSLSQENRPKLVIMYGRRRVGKTALLMEFAKQHHALYLVARQEALKDQLHKMSEEIAGFFHDEVLHVNHFQNYDALFRYLEQKKVPVIFDEFPFLVESEKALPSILQEHWDKYFSKKASFIILCGSSIRMMESLLGYQSPLYGRRTEQMHIEPLTFWETQLFFPKGMTAEEQIQYYAILGGTPAYILEFDFAKGIEKNIMENVLQKNTFLYQDTLFVLQQELNEPRIYYSLIKAIASGATTLGEIMNGTGLDKGVVSKYAGVLQQLHLIQRQVPITEKHAEKSRKGIYVLADNYFKFWFKFVFEYAQFIEQQKQEALLQQKIIPQLPAFIGKAYEEIALAWMQRQKAFHNFLVGRWWDKEEEIDIVGVPLQGETMLFGEVKWKALQERDVGIIFEELQRKAKLVNSEGEVKSSIYVIIGKNIPAKKKLCRKNLFVYDVKDIVRG